MSRVFVTGGTGFIGSHLVAALAKRGDSVVCLARQSSNTEQLDGLGVEIVRGNVFDREVLRKAIEGADYVFHLAAMTRAVRREQLDEANASGSENVSWACAMQPTPPTLIQISSLAAAGPSQPESLKTELDPSEPISNYGRSKRGGELAAHQYADKVPTTIIRPGIVFGEGGKEMLEMFRPISRFGVHVVPNPAPDVVSLIYVGDLIEIILAAADRGHRIEPSKQDSPTTGGEGYYFATAPEHPDLAELGHMISHAVGREQLRVVNVPKPVMLASAGVNEITARISGRPAIVNMDKVREATASGWGGSGEAAERDLDFMPSESLLNRLQQTAAWYFKHDWL